MYESALHPRLSAPIVLAHGLCGFQRYVARNRPVRDYFPGIRQFLEACGNRVYVPLVSPTASIATRAAELKAFIRREVGRGPVHIFGHSLGGLDARYMISKLKMAGQVLSLTSVGTPHWGSTFADWAVSRFARMLHPLFRAVGLPDDAFFDLTTDRCRRFNDEVPNVSGVRYFSVAAVCDRPWLGREWELPYRIVGKAEGPNDGVVSLASATWGERTDVWAGDHLNLVNWPNRFMQRAGQWHDRAPEYGRLLGRLAAEGY